MDHDAIVIGGGFAGLAAATYLARARRKVCVVDTRRPRNRFAKASHGFLGQDGSNPLEILAAARKQLDAYPTAALLQDEAVAASRENAGFAVTMASGRVSRAGKIILAFGLRDELPDIPGLQERWGQTVLHCPYCHGIEFSDRQLGVLYRTEMSVHQALIVAEWGPVTLYLDGAELEPEAAQKLAERKIKVEAGRVAALEGQGTSLSSIRLDNGRRAAIDALYIAPRSCLSSPLADQLDLAIDETPTGPIIRTDGEKMTSVPGIYAAGDIARAPHSVSWAVADGVTAGTSAHRAMVFG